MAHPAVDGTTRYRQCYGRDCHEATSFTSPTTAPLRLAAWLVVALGLTVAGPAAAAIGRLVARWQDEAQEAALTTAAAASAAPGAPAAHGVRVRGRIGHFAVAAVTADP